MALMTAVGAALGTRAYAVRPQQSAALLHSMHPPAHLACIRILLERKQRIADAEVSKRVGRLHPHCGLEGVDRLAVAAADQKGGWTGCCAGGVG